MQSPKATAFDFDGDKCLPAISYALFHLIRSFDTFLLVSQAFCLCLRALMCFSSVQEAFAPFPTKQTSIRFTSLTKLYDDISMFLHGWLDPTTIELRINIFLRHSSHAFAFSFSSLLWDERENIFELVT